MQAFTTSHKDPLTAAAASILFNEDLSTVKDKIKELKVGDVTNFGTVTKISDNSIEFKARDTGKTTIALNQRKMGSKDFVLDKLIKLTKEEVELEEAKAADPANLRSIIVNHTKLLSKATEPDAKNFHKTAIANAKEKLKSLGEEVELDEEDDTIEEGINFAAVAKAKKDGMSDAAIDSFVKIHKANGRTDKEISAMLMTGKGLKEEADVVSEEYKTRSPKVIKILDQIDGFSGGEWLDFWKGFQQYAQTLADGDMEDDKDSWGVIANLLAKAVKEYQLHINY